MFILAVAQCQALLLLEGTGKGVTHRVRLPAGRLNKSKGYSFEVDVETGKTTSVVLSDQVKSLDWRQRRAKFKSKISSAQLKQVRENIKALLCIS